MIFMVVVAVQDPQESVHHVFMSAPRDTFHDDESA